MSWTDEELDALVREAANDKKIAYKDAYWKEMEAMLGSTPVRKTLGWWWFSGVAFLGTIITAAFVASNATIETPMQSTILASINQNTKTSKSNQLADGESNIATEVANSLEISNVNSDNFEQSNPEKSVTYKNPNATNSGSQNLNSSKKANKRSISNVDPNSEVFKVSIAGNSAKQAFETQPVDSEDLSDVNLANIPESKNAPTVTISSLQLMNWNSTMESSFDRTQNDVPYLTRRRIGFYASLSGGIGQSYLASERNNTMREFGLQGGVEFFTKKWSFGVGLGYRQQFVDNLTIQNRKQYYTYGLLKINQSLNYDQLLFADLNLSANYRLGRSELGINTSPSYLLGARLNYSENREEIMGDKTVVSTMPSEKNQFVSSTNFKSFGVNLGLSYNYLLKRNTWIGLNVNTRIGGNLLNNSFSGTQRTVPIMVDFGIKKRF